MHKWFLFTLIDKNFIAFVLSNYKYFFQVLVLGLRLGLGLLQGLWASCWCQGQGQLLLLGLGLQVSVSVSCWSQSSLLVLELGRGYAIGTPLDLYKQSLYTTIVYCVGSYVVFVPLKQRIPQIQLGLLVIDQHLVIDRGTAKNKLLGQNRWFTFFHSELSIYMKQHSISTCIWSIYISIYPIFQSLWFLSGFP